MSIKPRVAVVIAKNFEDIEATGPIDAVLAAGGEIVVIGVEKGPVEGKKGAIVDATITFDELTPEHRIVLRCAW